VAGKWGLTQEEEMERGRVARIVREIMKQRPGTTITEIGDVLPALNQLREPL
jgi:hypothetical protein